MFNKQHILRLEVRYNGSDYSITVKRIFKQV